MSSEPAVIRLRVPAPSGVLASNLLGVVGLVLIVAAVGMLAGTGWATLAAGIIATALALVAQYAEPVTHRPEPTTHRETPA